MVYNNIYQLMNINISSKNMSNKIPLSWEVNSWLAFHLLLQKNIFLLVIFTRRNRIIFKKYFSPCHVQKEKKIQKKIFFLWDVYKQKNNCLNLSNKRYFSGTKKTP